MVLFVHHRYGRTNVFSLPRIYRGRGRILHDDKLIDIIPYLWENCTGGVMQKELKECLIDKLEKAAQEANDPDFRGIWQEKINELQKEKEI
jgi:hypothetical protein|tara:strand:+ start:777 stop:1049 length:273 start_codon:yes stop_codon:yes gene_type:complete